MHATRASSRELFKSMRAMVEPQVLVECAQSAAEHAARLKCLMGRRAIASTAKRRADDLETNAYRMELEAKASLLRRWQGRLSPQPSHPIAAAVTLEAPYLDARALATYLHVVSKGVMGWLRSCTHTGDSVRKFISANAIWSSVESARLGTVAGAYTPNGPR